MGVNYTVKQNWQLGGVFAFMVHYLYSRCLLVSYLAKRALDYYKEHGLALLMYVTIYWLARGCLCFLNIMNSPVSYKRYIVREILGSKMYLDLADDGISGDLIADGIREAYQVEQIKRELKKGNIVIDIGANIGYYALLEAKLVGDEGKVYAIEPDPSNMDLLRKNIALNPCSNIELYQLAAGDMNGFLPMYLSRKRNLNTLRDVTGTSKERYFKSRIDVETVTLYDFLKNKPYPNAIRMDVEGYEYQIIRGMGNLLREKSPLTLFIEFHFHLLKEQESLEMLQTLKDAGFSIADISSEIKLRGRYRYKFLSGIVSLMEAKRESYLHYKPARGNLGLSIDDILLDPYIINGHWGALYICFKRN